MTREGDDFWDALGHHLDPIQVPMLEALWRIGVPLSAIDLVDVLDGYLTMWEAAHHLEVLQGRGVVEPTSGDKSSRQATGFDLTYRLRIGP